MTTAISQSKPGLGAIWRNGVIAAVVAAVINAILFYIGAAAGGFPTSVLTPMGVPITISTVLVATVVGILVGTLGYTILSRLTTNPNRWFTILAVIVLVLMVYNPFTLPGAPVLMIAILQIMHLVAGGAAIYFLARS
jgi:hypothetical protein